MFAEPGVDSPGSLAAFAFEATEPVEPVGRLQLQMPVESLGGDAHLFAKLHHVASETAPVIYEQVAAMRVGEPTTLDEELTTVQQGFVPGDRLRLTLSTTDSGYFGSREAAGIVLSHGVSDQAELSVPLITEAEDLFGLVVATPGSIELPVSRCQS
ncbi:hypothetical protein BRC88_02640 [Halobacteriales archaeon QS_4_69_225]|nr:MAG: hypothetical protein BRC88_02640 [Halobacteriales archaeon QS_4_69_225]